MLARCVCVLTKRPLLLDLHVAVLRDALAETRAADDATRRLALREIFGRYQRLAVPRPGARISFAVAKETRELAVPGPDDALTYLGDGWRRATPALAWTRRDYGAIAAAAAACELPDCRADGAAGAGGRALRLRSSSSPRRPGRPRRPASTA